MAILEIVFGLFQILIQHVQFVGDELDEETRKRMEQRVEMLNREMTRLWQEVEEQWSQEQRNQEQMNQEQRDQEQSSFAWVSLLFSALQDWQSWAIAGVLLLVFWLYWWFRKWSREPEIEDESSDSNVEEEEHEEENDNGNEAEEDNDDANEAQEENHEANEAQEQNDDANQVEEENDDANEDQEVDDDQNDQGRFFEEHMQWPIQQLDRDCKTVSLHMEIYILAYKFFFSDSSLPVLENAIEVGSAFEGWSPREEDITFRMLLPLKPPHGHIFHLELGPECLGRNFRIRVELVCTCEMEQPTGETRCFLHDPEEEQRRKEGTNILDDLCTDSYLDVQKTARFFQMFVRRAWRALPISAERRINMLPSYRSCKFQLIQHRGRRILIELLFGVQEGDSDIFVSSQYTEAAYTPSTMWPESYAVAEMKFFTYIANQAQPDSYHLRCLQLCVRSLLGRDFSTYTLKTVVMHLLTTIPLSDWRRRHLLARLLDIMQYLQSCLENRCLNHFFIGNANVPEKIILPLELRMAEPLNLFQHLAQNPDAHKRAQLEFEDLRRRLSRMVLHGR